MKKLIGIIIVFAILMFVGCSGGSSTNNNNGNVAPVILGIWESNGKEYLTFKENWKGERHHFSNGYLTEYNTFTFRINGNTLCIDFHEDWEGVTDCDTFIIDGNVLHWMRITYNRTENVQNNN